MLCAAFRHKTTKSPVLKRQEGCYVLRLSLRVQTALFNNEGFSLHLRHPMSICRENCAINANSIVHFIGNDDIYACPCTHTHLVMQHPNTPPHPLCPSSCTYAVTGTPHAPNEDRPAPKSSLTLCVATSGWEASRCAASHSSETSNALSHWRLPGNKADAKNLPPPP